jgi:tetratricopeptide (TPR) repeat protein
MDSGRRSGATEAEDPELNEIAAGGLTLLEHGRAFEARVIFEGLCALRPSSVAFQSALGAAYLALDQLEKALGSLTRALSIDPKLPGALADRGEAKLRSGDVGGALSDLRMALRLERRADLAERVQALLVLARIETGEAQPTA